MHKKVDIVAFGKKPANENEFKKVIPKPKVIERVSTTETECAPQVQPKQITKKRTLQEVTGYQEESLKGKKKVRLD